MKILFRKKDQSLFRNHIGNLIRLISVVGLILLFGGIAVQATTSKVAVKSTLNIMVEDKQFAPEVMTGYVIDGRSYYKIRDIAEVISGNGYSQFDVLWNREKRMVEIKKNHSYSGQKTLLTWSPYRDQYIYVNMTAATLLVDGQVKEINAFAYKGSYYVDLSELKKVIGFDTKWNPSKKAVALVSQVPVGAYPIEKINENQYKSQLEYNETVATPKEEYLYAQGENYYLVNRTQRTDGKTGAMVRIRKYGKDWQLLQNIDFPMYGEIWAGFYHGKESNYFVFGNLNKNDDDKKTVLTLVKTDHNFTVQRVLNINNAYTYYPFEAGSLSMAEWGDYLIVHTARLRYFTKEDGLRHQSQLTVAVNTKEMKVLNHLGAFQVNHVGHSFNQFALFDESGNLFLVDHGDALPKRAIQILKTNAAATDTGKAMYLFDFPGKEGVNQTGVFIGGVEQGKKNILLALNQIDYSRARNFSHKQISDANGQPITRRNVFVYLVDKSGAAPYRGVALTDYTKEDQVTYSSPKIVRVSNANFMVIWEKMKKNKDGQVVSKLVQAQIIDENGQRIGETKSYPWYRLGKSTPIFHEGKVMWQASGENQTAVYTITVN